LKKKQLSLFFYYFSLKLKPVILKKNNLLFFSLENTLINNEKFFYISKNSEKSILNKTFFEKQINNKYIELYNKFFFIFNKINFFFDKPKKNYALKKELLPILYDLKEISLETNKRILLVSKNYQSLLTEDLLTDIFKIFQPHKKLIHFRKIRGKGARKKVSNFYSKFNLEKNKSNSLKKQPLH
jgi:hypothetical protein